MRFSAHRPHIAPQAETGRCSSGFHVLDGYGRSRHDGPRYIPHHAGDGGGHLPPTSPGKMEQQKKQCHLMTRPFFHFAPRWVWRFYQDSATSALSCCGINKIREATEETADGREARA